MSSMLPVATAPITAATGSARPVPRFFEDPARDQAVKDQIVAVAQRLGVARAAAMVEVNFNIAVSREQMRAVWDQRHAPKTETAPALDESRPDDSRPDKESVCPADQPGECRFTLPDVIPEPEPPLSVVTDPAPAEAASAQTGPAPAQAVPAATKAPPPKAQPQKGVIWEKVRVRKLSGDIQDYIIDRMARHQPPTMIAETLEQRFGVCVDPEQIVVCWRDRNAPPIQTGCRQKRDSRRTLSDEVKEFIVKRLACYETPSRVAAAVRSYFGIDIDRRQIFAYDPAGSRPPAQRWIDLHAATRARYLKDTAGIAVAQKAVRLRMLDRLAQTAEEDSRDDRLARFLAQAARECGGFYDKQPLPFPALAAQG